MPTPSTQEALQKQLDLVVEAGIPGISAAIGSRGRVIWRGQAGSSDVTSNVDVSPKHLFGIGSITKVFASVVALQLHEEKLLSLSAKLGQYLDKAILENTPNAGTATTASLLCHTSGITSWGDPVWIRVGRGEDIDPLRSWGKSDTQDNIQHPSVLDSRKPGKFAYSNTNFTLLGLVIQVITCSTAESEIGRWIVTPLKLTSTFLEGLKTFLRRELQAGITRITQYFAGMWEFLSTSRKSRRGWQI
jgi:D-alanyl-D-alanine carboxypeptidase